MLTTDFLVIGGGIVGLTIALELKRRFPDTKVVLIEKEPQCGAHASGRNSGVLHAGFYYSSDSLKAKFTRAGNQALTQYCDGKDIVLNKCGKIVVAANESELSTLDELLRRARANGVALHSISAAEAKEIEPRVKTFQRALFSPTTASVDPVAVLSALKNDSRISGVEIHEGVTYFKNGGNHVITSNGNYAAGYIVNAGGLYADKIAKDFGFSENHVVLPFKGLYLYSNEPVGSIRTHIYPVPDIRNPFLGVHFTVTVAGKVKIGPTAIPCFWREQYSGWSNFKLREFIDITIRQAGLLTFSDFNFKTLAITELKKYSRKMMVKLADALAEGVEEKNYRQWGQPGIRAQLLNLKQRKLEMDFVIEGDNRSVHVLNAVSPAFTCAIPFSRYVCDEVSRRAS